VKEMPDKSVRLGCGHRGLCASVALRLLCEMRSAKERDDSNDSRPRSKRRTSCRRKAGPKSLRNESCQRPAELMARRSAVVSLARRPSSPWLKGDRHDRSAVLHSRHVAS
jgi:hypothetical protein